MSFGSSYFTLLRATMIGLSAQAPLAEIADPRVPLTHAPAFFRRGPAVSSSTPSLLSPFGTPFSSRRRGTRRYIIMRIYAFDVVRVCVARVCGWHKKEDNKSIVVKRKR
ncbi:hypothetical protein ALC56_12020 [Trachymyrmex septentrionalis]|uniref:Uncharacterized protein n=1 Tax=Trachymyrmex septentrionalis TaxID=34720 RepID=A0A195F0S8_9HYME|nr:hypothetical protein ALC56_12020 [Trachymyrmex septentrionalis]